MQMKATLCVFVALVAVTSAAPAFMGSNRRAACTDNAWCTTACKCDSDGGGGDDCTAATKFCANVGAAGAVTDQCTALDGTTAITAACDCGASTVTDPGTCTVKADGTNTNCVKAWATTGGFSSASCTAASIGTCAGKNAADGTASTNALCTGTTTVEACDGLSKGTCAVKAGGSNDGCTGTTKGACLGASKGTCAVRSGGTNTNCASKTTRLTCTGTAANQGNNGVTDASNTCVFTETAANVCEFTVGTAATGECAVATPTAAHVCEYTARTSQWCFETSNGNGYKQTTQQCSVANANQADGTNAAAAACHCGTTAISAAVGKCQFCVASANYVGVNTAVAACATTDGTLPFLKKPNKCKCGTGVVDYGEYCGSTLTPAINGPVAACANNDGTVVNGATACACITSATGVSQVTAAGGLCNAGTASTVQPCTNDGTTGKTGSNVAPCTCGTGNTAPTCTTGQTCVASTKTCAAPAAPSPTPAGSTTIAQKITFSGTQASYTGTLKTFSEQAYGKALDIFDTAATPPAYKTGCSVTSVASASRRAYAVTFTATVASAQSSAASTASTALTASGFATAAAAVKTANNAAYGSVTAPTATAVAAPSITTPTTVSGASTVTTSIMAMAVAVLAAFQARQ